MKRAAISTVALAALAACSTAPMSFMTTTPEPAESTFSCALRQLNTMNYTVVNANKEAGFIAAEKQTSGLGTQLLTGKKYGSALTVSVFDGSDGQRRLRLTAGQSTENAVLFGAASKTTGKPSAKGISDAKSVLMTCGKGDIIQQSLKPLFIGMALSD